jgi:hypothetical protein
MLIIIGILVASIICWIIANKIYSDIAMILTFLLLVVAVFGSIFGITGIIDAQVNGDVNYQNKLYEKEMLEYRIDNMENDIVGNEMLYNDIVEFNNELRSIKKWANNPWTNWFYNQDIATIDYVELDGK